MRVPDREAEQDMTLQETKGLTGATKLYGQAEAHIVRGRKEIRRLRSQRLARDTP
jgi:hypothetical protein